MNIVASIPLWIGAAFTFMIGMSFLIVTIRDSPKPQFTGQHVAIGVLTGLALLAASSGLAVLAIRVAS